MQEILTFIRNKVCDASVLFISMTNQEKVKATLKMDSYSKTVYYQFNFPLIATPLIPEHSLLLNM